MKKLYFSLITVFFLQLTALDATMAQSEFVWAEAAGSDFSDRGQAIAADSLGNSYVTGSFSSTAYFGTTQLTSYDIFDDDIFVAKYDPLGNLEWVVQAGGPNYDYGKSIAVDNFGNVFVTGRYQGTAYFGSTQISSVEYTFDEVEYYPSDDIFIAKYSNSGTLLWVRSAGGEGQDEGLGIDTDGAGNSFVTGYFSVTAAFGPGAQITSNGGYDVFVAKYDPLGNLIWVIGDGGPESEQGNAIATDPAGGSHVTGSFSGTATFTGAPSITSTTYVAPDNSYSFSSLDIFLVKYDPFGTALWARSAGGDQSDAGMDVEIDALGNAYITGYFAAEANFGSINITGYPDDPEFPSSDIFIAAYDPLGTPLWAKSAGGLGSDQGLGIAVDPDGSSYIIGYFTGQSSFDSFTITSYQDNSNSYFTEDIFLANYNNAGAAQWVVKAGGTGPDVGNDVASINTGFAFITGYFYEPTALFPGAGNITSNGYDDIFVAMYGDVSVLPVTLVHYSAEKDGQAAILTWQTATETDNAGFEIEVSTDGKTFSKLASVEPKIGASSYGATYRYSDSGFTPAGTRYYRIWQHDLNGTKTSLGVRALSFENQQVVALGVAPNPFHHHVQATIEPGRAQKAQVRLTDGLGREIAVQDVYLEAGENQVTFSNTGNLRSGLYLLTVQLETRLISTRIIKQ